MNSPACGHSHLGRISYTVLYLLLNIDADSDYVPRRSLCVAAEAEMPGRDWRLFQKSWWKIEIEAINFGTKNEVMNSFFHNIHLPELFEVLLSACISVFFGGGL